MQNNDLVKSECYKRLRATSAISTDLSLVLEEQDRIVCQSARVITLEKRFGEEGVSISSRVIFNIIYSSEDGLQSYEGGANFEVQFSSEFLTEGVPLRLEYEVQKLRVKVSEGVVTVSAVIDAEVLFHYTKQVSLPSEIAGAICKKRGIECVQLRAGAATSLEIEGEKILPFLVKRLLQSQPRALVKVAECGIDEVVLEGEILNDFLMLTAGGKLQRESIATPFRIQVECKDAMPEMSALANVEISEVSYKIIGEADSEKCTILITYTLNAAVEVYERIQREIVEDAFFSKREIILESEEMEFIESIEGVNTAKKCFGEAICSLREQERVVAPLAYELCALNYDFSEGKTNISLVAKCTLITTLQDETLSSCEAEMPISLSLDTKTPPLDLWISEKHLTSKQNDGKIFIEGELIVCYNTTKTNKYNPVTNASEGEEKPQDDSTIGVIFIKEGETAWSVCKKAGIDEDSLIKQNLNLDFPAEKDCAVVVFKPAT